MAVLGAGVAYRVLCASSVKCTVSRVESWRDLAGLGHVTDVTSASVEAVIFSSPPWCVALFRLAWG